MSTPSASPFRADGSIDEGLVHLIRAEATITTRAEDSAGRHWAGQIPLPPGEIQYVDSDAVALAQVRAARQDLDALVKDLEPVIGSDRSRDLADAVNDLAVAIADAHAVRLLNLARSWLCAGQPLAAVVFQGDTTAAEYFTGER